LNQLKANLNTIQQTIILVSGQVESDASLRYGAPLIKTNLALLQTVRQENPHAYILYKPHPDVVAGLRKGGNNEDKTINYCDMLIIDIAMGQLLPLIDEVHTMTSLTGFEALLRGKKVVCYGRPFYSGWGLTEDKLEPIARRTRQLSLNQLIAATLILYPTYVSQSTNKFTSPERVLDELLVWRDNAPAQLPWWRKLLRGLLKIESFFKQLVAAFSK
jgi:capsular polysaccharide export protein